MRGTSATSLIPFSQSQTQSQVQANLSYYSPSSSTKSRNTHQQQQHETTPKSHEYNPLLSRFAQVMRLPSDARPPPQSTIVNKEALASYMEKEGNEKESYDIKLKTDLALLRINNILK